MSERFNPVNNPGIIGWFAHNPVAANLLMTVIILVGLYASLNVKRAVFPDLEINRINIQVIYPGAAPEEVERGVVLKIEEALKDVEGIERLDATADDSLARLSIEVHEDFDTLAVMDEVKSAVDAIVSFPAEAEKPVVSRLQMRNYTIQLQVYGNGMSEAVMKELAETVKQDLLGYPEISYVELRGPRPYEIAIEVPSAVLRQYNLTLEDVARAVRASSLDLPGGAIKTANGDISLRARGQAYQQYDFEQITLLTRADGTRLTLKDIAIIDDGFVEQDGFATFNGKPSMGVVVYAVGEQDSIAVANRVKQYIEEKRRELPEGVELAEWADVTYYLEDRLDMMVGNLIQGGLLVFLVLALFLEIKLAFWVMAGLPLTFLGTFTIMSMEAVDVSINMISLFGFILVLGIVVDDAIIIGESAYSVSERRGHSIDAVIEGAKRVATPATFGVLTTIVAFSPTLFTSGTFAPMPMACGVVVVSCLAFSLIESKWILPAHLAHSKPSQSPLFKQWGRLQAATNRQLRHFVINRYRPVLERCLDYRYTTLALFFSILILTIGLIAGGVVRYVLIPDVPSDFVRVELEMNEGVAEHQTRQAIERIESAIYAVERDYLQDHQAEHSFIKHLFVTGGEGRLGYFMLELIPNEQRSIDSNGIVKAWRSQVGEIAGAKVLSFSAADQQSGPALGYKLVGRNHEQLQQAAHELEQHMRTYQGVYDIENGATNTVDEIHLLLKPNGEALGLTLADLAQQVRHAFYGAEAQRLNRGNEEIKVIVRYPRSERESIATLERMYVHTPSGVEVPFIEVAHYELRPGMPQTTRINFERAISVTGKVDKAVVEPGRVNSLIQEQFMPELKRRYPGLDYKLDGESEEEAKMFTSLFLGFALALFGIYALLAVPLKSYLQPAIIMGVIPFGMIGAIIGHILLGYAFNMMSFFGVIALSGVVVNDSLILVDFYNKATAEGQSPREAVLAAGTQRFRAILLTSLTTFFGLVPMLLETSVQALIVVPMAVSLAFGIVFATVITLLLVPCLCLVLDDLKQRKQQAVWQAA